MINLSRQMALAIAVVLAVLLVLTLALSVSAVAMHGSPATAVVVVTTATPTIESATATATPTTESATVTATPTTESATVTATPTTESATVTATPTIESITPLPGNVLGNPSFDESPDQVETRWSFDSRASAADGAWSTAAARTGTRSLAITAKTAPQGGWPGWTTTNMIPIERGKTYTFSAWASSIDRSNAWIGINMYDAKGTFLVGFSTGCTSLQSTNQWRQLTVAASDKDRSAAGATQVKLTMQLCSPGGSGIGTTVYYDDVSFGVTSP